MRTRRAAPPVTLVTKRRVPFPLSRVHAPQTISTEEQSRLNPIATLANIRRPSATHPLSPFLPPFTAPEPGGENGELYEQLSKVAGDATFERPQRWSMAFFSFSLTCGPTPRFSHFPRKNSILILPSRSWERTLFSQKWPVRNSLGSGNPCPLPEGSWPFSREADDSFSFDLLQRFGRRCELI